MNPVLLVGLLLGLACVVIYGTGMVLTRRSILRWKEGDKPRGEERS